MHYQELDTPALLTDLGRMEANIARMSNLTKKLGVNLRPHTKTHKCPEIAKMQLESGATGITCAKLGEAEVMAAAGIDDILIANQIIGEQKFKRLIELNRKLKLCIAVDSGFGVRSLNDILEQAGQTIEVMLEINCGQNRAGVLPGEEALNLARKIAQLPKLRLHGLMTHGGHSYHATTEAEVKAIGMHEGTVMVETAELLRQNDIAVETVSVGSTPTVEYCGGVAGVTEVRPGTYVFYDLTQTKLFACNLDDCALSVLATVTSHPAPERVIVDAGKKALTSDANDGFGFIPEKNATLARLSEEHGVIEGDADFTIGEKVRIIPNHACVVVNMFDEMAGVRNGDVEKMFKIAGRGKTQ